MMSLRPIEFVVIGIVVLAVATVLVIVSSVRRRRWHSERGVVAVGETLRVRATPHLRPALGSRGASRPVARSVG